MYQLILCTCPDNESAHIIASTLVTKKLAACVNILPNVTSVYYWQDKVIRDTEIQLLIKTRSDVVEAVSLKIKELHPYEIPEIIALNIQQGDKDYLNWIDESLKQ